MKMENAAQLDRVKPKCGRKSKEKWHRGHAQRTYKYAIT